MPIIARHCSCTIVGGMPTVISHALVPAGAAPFLRSFSRRALLAASFCAMLPDVDVVGMPFGIAYGSRFGHRGFTHSIAFACLVAAIVTPLVAPRGTRAKSALLLAAATLSHGLLDMLTNGGRGVALFSPWVDTRLFFPWRPIAVSPIGVAFFSARGLHVLASELLWIGGPAAALFASGVLRNRLRVRGAPAAAPPTDSHGTR